MPWILWRYILIELLKLLAISTGVLLVVISTAATIKPMADGFLGPAALLRFVLYTAPTMLMFVLPFSAAFASTIVFLRMTSDNEIVACAASGISYRSVLAPVLVLGLALTVTMLGLSNFVIPRFFRAAAETVEQDLMTLLVSQLEKNRPFELGDMVVYADEARTVPVRPTDTAGGIRPARQVILRGVAVGRLDERNVPRNDATAEQANIALYHAEDRSWVTMRLANLLYYDPQRGELVWQRQMDVPAMALPSPLRDRPKFLSYPQLRQLRRDPQRNSDVQQRKATLVEAINQRAARAQLVAALDSEADGAVVFTGPLPGERYTLRAPKVHEHRGLVHLEGDSTPVQVRYESSDRPGRRYEASSGVLGLVSGDEPTRPRVELTLRDVRVFDATGQAGYTELSERTLPPLTLPEPALQNTVAEADAQALLELATQPPYNDDWAVVSSALKLDRELREVRQRIEGRLHERAGFAVATSLLLLLGAILAMLLRDQLPLVVYFWSFLLAILTIVTINSGQNLTGNPDRPLYISLAVLWGANAALGVVLGVVYCRLARN